jgi:hypothetical protein
LNTPEGFSWRSGKNGDLQVFHHGRLASTLRGPKAATLLEELEAGDDEAAQQVLARVTGNYKRGNEGLAAAHPRNRR